MGLPDWIKNAGKTAKEYGKALAGEHTIEFRIRQDAAFASTLKENAKKYSVVVESSRRKTQLEKTKTELEKEKTDYTDSVREAEATKTTAESKMTSLIQPSRTNRTDYIAYLNEKRKLLTLNH